LFRSEQFGHRAENYPTAALAYFQAVTQLAGNVLGDITGPALGRVETDDTDRVAILAPQNVPDNRF
jgi:hypothetical protein